MDLDVLALGVAGAFFFGALAVIAAMLWRSPVQLARTITEPLDRRLQEVADAVRATSCVNDSLVVRIDDHERRLEQLEAPCLSVVATRASVVATAPPAP